MLAIFSLLASPCLAAEPLTVSRVVDGNILQLFTGEQIVLIGVEAPEASNSFKLWQDAKKTGRDTKEILEMGKEAAEFVRKLVEGKQVRLEYDVQRKDKYGRTLAYVFIPTKIPTGAEYERRPNDGLGILEDGLRYKETFVNATLVYEGYSQVMIMPPNAKYQELFVRLEKEAKERKKGVWREKVEADGKNMNYKFGVEDTTGLGNVRTSNAKVGADYKMSKNSAVGVEVRRGIHDSQDASAWGKSVDDETAAQAKYKLSF